MYIIYKTTNLINGKIYVGQHKTDIKEDGYLGSGKLLRLAILKYGINNFIREILATCDTRKSADMLQRFFIKQLNSKQLGYNIHNGGQGFQSELNPNKTDKKYGERNPFYGRVHTQETKNKIRKTIQIKYDSRRGEYNGMFNRKHTQQSKKKMSQHSKGLNSGEKNASKRPEVRKRISESKLGIKNGNAKIWTLIFPDGFKVEIFGGIKRHLRQYGLTMSNFSKNGECYYSRRGHTLLKRNKDQI